MLARTDGPVHIFQNRPPFPLEMDVRQAHFDVACVRVLRSLHLDSLRVFARGPLSHDRLVATRRQPVGRKSTHRNNPHTSAGRPRRPCDLHRNFGFCRGGTSALDWPLVLALHLKGNNMSDSILAAIIAATATLSASL